MDSRSSRSLRVAVGQRIADARRGRGWTQAALAEALEIEGSTLSRYECGVRETPLHLLLDIARTLHVPLSELLVVPEGTLVAPERPVADAVPEAPIPKAEDVLALWPRLDAAERVLVLAVARALAT